MKVKETGIARKDKPQSTFLPSFMTAMVMASEQLSMFEFFQIFKSAPVVVTSGEGHPNWYAVKGLATKYHCAKFHDCKGYGVWANIYV